VIGHKKAPRTMERIRSGEQKHH